MNSIPTDYRRVLGLSLPLLTAPLLWSQAAPASGSGSDRAGPDEIITLSPFEVRSDTKGYYSSNTMSGTRFNTKLEDLATSITVMTKEQMQDFAMLDVNDVFMYAGNTEGTATYSDMSIDRNGQLVDNVQLNPSQANRIRGVSAANVSYGNFETMGYAPLDPIVLDGVEISRGPNANVFGLGNPGGTVNQVPAAANVQRTRTRVEARWDSYDGYRASLDTNQVLIKNKLALRASIVDQHEGFVRKPSGMDTRRYNAMVKYQPFKNTTINASYLYFKSDGNRPNYTPPRDFVSYWVQSGKPGWDPITQSVHVNGQTFGPFINDNFLSTSQYNYFQRAGGQFQRSNVFVDRDGVAYWTATANNTGSTPTANTGTGANFIRLMGSTPGANTSNGKYTTQPLFASVPSVVSKDLYDWSSINLAAPNRVSDEVKTYLVTIDQILLNSQRQLLAVQLGYFREDGLRYRRTPIGDAGTSGQNGQLWVDVNERNLDGTVNPFFGRTYIGVNEPRTWYTPQTWETSRAQVAYRYDFTQNDNWTRWLGTHQFSGYYEYKYRIYRNYSYREAIASKPSWLVAGSGGIAQNFAPANQSNIPGGPQAGPNIAREFFRYYVGDANGTNVDYAPGSITHGDYVFHWGTTGNWREEVDTLGLIATTDNTGGTNNLKKIVKTKGGVVQSHFLKGLVVTTLGLREDKVFSKFGYQPQQLLNGNTEHDYSVIDHWADGDYRASDGRTKTYQVVVRPLRDVGLVNRWADQGTGVKGFVGEVLRSASVYYNKSDNFFPAPPAIDLFMHDLPNTTGKGRDWGVRFNLFKEKLVIGINRYETKMLNVRDGEANTIAQRVLRLDMDVSTDRTRLYTRATDWYRLTNPGWTPAQVEDAVFKQMQMTPQVYNTLSDAFRSGTLAATNDVVAKGTEIDVAFNPTPYWTISANAEEKKSINENVSSTVQEWINLRMPVWQSIVDQNFDPNLTAGTTETTGWVPTADNPNHLWWLHSYAGSQTPAQNFAVNVEQPWSIIRETEGKSRPQVRRYAARISTNLSLNAITDHHILKNFNIGGALRWEDKGAIGYWGVETYPATINHLDPNRPIWDEDHFYIDALISYRTKLFRNRISAKFQLNVRNIQENGRLQAVGAFPNGEPHSYRIVDPRIFILSATFEL